jgi:hypothetical protein
VVDSLQTFLLYNVLSDQPESLRSRIMAGPVITVKTTEAPSQGDANNPFAFIAAIAAGILFIVAINSSGGYLMQAMVEEKRESHHGDHSDLAFADTIDGRQSLRESLRRSDANFDLDC